MEFIPQFEPQPKRCRVGIGNGLGQVADRVCKAFDFRDGRGRWQRASCCAALADLEAATSLPRGRPSRGGVWRPRVLPHPREAGHQTDEVPEARCGCRQRRRERMKEARRRATRLRYLGKRMVAGPAFRRLRVRAWTRAGALTWIRRPYDHLVPMAPTSSRSASWRRLRFLYLCSRTLTDPEACSSNCAHRGAYQPRMRVASSALVTPHRVVAARTTPAA